MTQGQDLPPGANFADFTIEGVLGRGGMGVVYRARQERLSRLVALKVIAPHLAHDVGFRERFRREAAMAAAIDHPSILPIYEAGEFAEQPFIVMRHVDGTDLKTLIERKGRLEPRRAVEVIADIAGALDAAHRRGLVHRDVKPANILIGDEGDDEVVYLTDFGLTKGRGDERLTQTGKWVGTVDYMAPEQIEGKDIDGRADEYALAATAYHLPGHDLIVGQQRCILDTQAHQCERSPYPSCHHRGARLTLFLRLAMPFKILEVGRCD
jgi:serine/threonine protein kinase